MREHRALVYCLSVGLAVGLSWDKSWAADPLIVCMAFVGASMAVALWHLSEVTLNVLFDLSLRAIARLRRRKLS